MSSASNQRDVPTNNLGEDSYGSRMVRNQEESERLDLQHQLMTRSVGYLVHPTISHRLVSGCKIADVATGTGVFLREISEQFKDPSMELHGFDISADQYPPTEKLAGNIKLHLSDAKKGFEEEFHGKFDIVNIRLLSAAMNTEKDWRDVAQNTLALLKPGGYLQWTEGTLDQVATILCGVPGGDPEFSALIAEGLQKMFPVGDGGDANSSWPIMTWSGKNLARVLKELGAAEVRQDNTSTDRCLEDRQTYTSMFIWAYRMIAAASVGTNGFKSMDEVREWHDKLQKMAKSGKAYMRYDIHTFIARKAS